MLLRGGWGMRGGEKIVRESIVPLSFFPSSLSPTPYPFRRLLRRLERAMHESSCCHAGSYTRRDVSLTSSSSPRFQCTSRSAPYWITLWKNEKNMPSIPWKPFGLNNILPRRFPRQRRGNKRQPIIPLKEWKIVRGDTVRKRVI